MCPVTTSFLEPRASVTESMALDVRCLDSNLVVITLSGDWSQASLDDMHCLMESHWSCFPEDGGQVTVQAGEDFHWQQQLPPFLYSVLSRLLATGFTVDFADLPDELCGVMELAGAVPANKSTQSEKKAPFSPFFHTVSEISETLIFIGEMAHACARLFTGRSHMRVVDGISALSQVGPQALGILSLVSVLVGMILAYLGIIQLQQFGAEVYVANLVGLGMVREMGALMTAVIMAGRTGAAWAAELGAMKVSEEIDALTTMGIRPMDFLVAPRILAMLIMMPLLCLYSFALGMLGGGVVAITMDITPRMYMHSLFSAFGPIDILIGCFKGLVFGQLITLAGCQAGMNCGTSSAAVGKATTRAVVTAIVFFIVADAGLNILFFHLGI